jgi:hypothetical protein
LSMNHAVSGAFGSLARTLRLEGWGSGLLSCLALMLAA